MGSYWSLAEGHWKFKKRTCDLDAEDLGFCPGSPLIGCVILDMSFDLSY